MSSKIVTECLDHEIRQISVQIFSLWNKMINVMTIDMKSVNQIIKNKAMKIQERRRDRLVISQRIVNGIVAQSGRDESEVNEDEEDKTLVDAGREFIKSQSNMNTVRNKHRPLPPPRGIRGDLTHLVKTTRA